MPRNLETRKESSTPDLEGPTRRGVRRVIDMFRRKFQITVQSTQALCVRESMPFLLLIVVSFDFGHTGCALGM